MRGLLVDDLAPDADRCFLFDRAHLVSCVFLSLALFGRACCCIGFFFSSESSYRRLRSLMSCDHEASEHPRWLCSISRYLSVIMLALRKIYDRPASYFNPPYPTIGLPLRADALMASTALTLRSLPRRRGGAIAYNRVCQALGCFPPHLELERSALHPPRWLRHHLPVDGLSQVGLPRSRDASRS